MKLNQKIRNINHSRIEQRAKDIYQVEEYEGELWLTFDGNLICPATKFNADPLVVLKEIRESYVKRSEKQ